jgi:hypothetical protein
MFRDKLNLCAAIFLLALPVMAQSTDSIAVNLTVSAPSPSVAFDNRIIAGNEINLRLPAGIYPVTIYKNIRSWDSPLLVDTLRINNIQTVLQKEYAFPVAETKCAISPPVKAVPVESFAQSGLFKMLIGGFLLSGGTAVYFKHKADIEFDAYTFTKNEAARTRAKTYDAISGAAFAGMQINFGLLIFYFLTNY